LGDIEIDLPSLDEQRRIADFLDAETSRIGRIEFRLKQQIELLRERLESKWSAAITDLGSEHGWIPLRRFVTSITDGPFGSALTSEHYSDEGARVIRLGNIGQAVFRDTDRAYIPHDYAAQLGRHAVRGGDLLIAGLGDDNFPLGRACVAPYDIGAAIVKADCFRVRLDQRRVTHEYAAWALSSPPVARQVALLAHGSTRARINLNIAREIMIPIPPLSDQATVSTELADVRAELSVIEHRCRLQLVLLDERRQALATAVATGQMDVTCQEGPPNRPQMSLKDSPLVST
jgi:type I restriction enzyme S subunit